MNAPRKTTLANGCPPGCQRAASRPILSRRWLTETLVLLYERLLLLCPRCARFATRGLSATTGDTFQFRIQNSEFRMPPSAAVCGWCQPKSRLRADYSESTTICARCLDRMRRRLVWRRRLENFQQKWSRS